MDINLLIQSSKNWKTSPRIREQIELLLVDNDDLPLVQRVFLEVNQMQLPCCAYCSKPAKFKSFDKGYSDICKGPADGPCARKKAKSTMVERFGSEYGFTMPDFQEKSIATCLSRYGFEHASQHPDIIQKSKDTSIANNSYETRMDTVRETCLRKYGVEFYVQAADFKQKARDTLVERYNVTHNWAIPSVIADKKITWLSTLGVDNPSKSESVKRKKEATSIQNYGTPHAMQNADFAFTQLKNSYAKKQVTINNKMFTCQGYEPEALKTLVNTFGIGVDDIETNYSLYPVQFKYVDTLGNSHVYFPDIYVKSLNLFIEVKSTYTVTQDVNILLKKQSVLDNNFEYVLWVI